jgi:hypothetical protein
MCAEGLEVLLISISASWRFAQQPLRYAGWPVGAAAQTFLEMKGLEGPN